MIEYSIVQKIIIWSIPVLFAISLHEVAHGWVASWFGDYTAKLAGRLSVNPLKHIDPFGTILVPLLTLVMSNFNFVIGWAKPVPVDARNLRHPRRDMAFVALAGPLTNILMALFWGVMYRLGVNFANEGMLSMGAAGVMINAVLAALNLLPLPPLDGGRVLMSLLPPKMAYRLSLAEPYGFLILIILMLTGVLSFVISPIISGLIDFVQLALSWI